MPVVPERQQQDGAKASTEPDELRLPEVHLHRARGGGEVPDAEAGERERGGGASGPQGNWAKRRRREPGALAVSSIARPWAKVNSAAPGVGSEPFAPSSTRSGISRGVPRYAAFGELLGTNGSARPGEPRGLPAPSSLAAAAGRGFVLGWLGGRGRGGRAGVSGLVGLLVLEVGLDHRHRRGRGGAAAEPPCSLNTTTAISGLSAGAKAREPRVRRASSRGRPLTRSAPMRSPARCRSCPPPTKSSAAAVARAAGLVHHGLEPVDDRLEDAPASRAASATSG